MNLIFPSDSVIVVAGVPGAGKTTLLRRAVDRSVARVVDTDDRVRRGPLLYPGHYARIAAAVLGRRPVVIHSRGTLPLTRRTIALLARLRGRPAHLVLLHADRASAEAGQRRRGRTVSEEEMDRQVARWHALMAGPVLEGWTSVRVLDRASAGDVDAFEFVPVARPVLQAA
ncbi:AAA family ATPase [Solirubrobacter soli]|uniref:AAA family ATPase n=1 Tax=Solirubrobacter soli TaxID=363832 RepID=UPI00041175DE|nr:AAA family ATPase [Solirubrobacter soli]